MDPAVIDRKTKPVLGISEGDQPVRSMTIPGIERAIHARILSSSLRGAATRIVRLTPGWGSRLVGAFTADVEIFVLKGGVQIGSLELTDYDYAFIPGGGVVGGFRSETGAVALLMTSAPVRYDTSTGGRRADVTVGRPGETRWEADPAHSGLFRRDLATSAVSEVWLGSTQLGSEPELWHRHAHDEETFVLEGSIRSLDLVDDEVVEISAVQGSYFYRPGESAHAAATALGEEANVTFHRSMGPFDTTLIDRDSDEVAVID